MLPAWRAVTLDVQKTRFIVIACDKREAFAQGSEATRQSIFPA